MREVKKILIGMNRPTREEVYALLGKRGVSYMAGYFWCRCFSPEIAAHVGSIEPHYNAGHYDEPVYKYVWEENGKIMESLTNPEENA